MWRLLICGLKGRTFLHLVIVAAVAFTLVAALTASVMTREMQNELAGKQELLGPELALVPTGTRETGHVYLTRGLPARGTIAMSQVHNAKTLKGVVGVTAQKVLGVVEADGRTFTLVAFDPASDMLVLPWLEDGPGTGAPGSLGKDVFLAGSEAASAIGHSLERDGEKRSLAGVLRPSGSFLDTCLFLPVSEAELGPEPTWALMTIEPGESVDLMLNRIQTNLENVEVISRPEALKTINDQLRGVSTGDGVGWISILVEFGAFLITGGMFVLMIHERRREFGLLKAMGANNGFVFRLVMGEASLLGLMGALAGILMGLGLCLVLLGPARMLDILMRGEIWLQTGLFFVGTVCVCVAAALFPAAMAARLNPYDAIRAGE